MCAPALPNEPYPSLQRGTAVGTHGRSRGLRRHMSRTSACVRPPPARCSCRHGRCSVRGLRPTRDKKEAHMTRCRTRQRTVMFVVSLGLALGADARAQVPPLSELPVPTPPNLAEFVRDVEAATVLGKALFWDMQVGSDGVACGSCHFQAGADPRR